MIFDLFIGGNTAGTVSAEAEGGRVLLSAACPLLGDGIYKAFLAGGSGKLPIGVMMPQSGQMIARRSVSAREMSALGDDVRGEAVMTVRFGAAPAAVHVPQPQCPAPPPCPAAQDSGDWIPEPQPSRLFTDPFAAALWEDIPNCRIKAAGGGDTLLAAVIDNDAPFSPVPMFCLGKAETIRNEPCLVFRINPAGHPVPME